MVILTHAVSIENIKCIAKHGVVLYDRVHELQGTLIAVSVSLVLRIQAPNEIGRDLRTVSILQLHLKMSRKVEHSIQVRVDGMGKGFRDPLFGLIRNGSCGRIFL